MHLFRTINIKKILLVIFGLILFFSLCSNTFVFAQNNTVEQPDTGSSTTTETKKTDSSSKEGLEGFKILSYDCIFKLDGCKKPLLEDVKGLLVSLSTIVATLVIIWGGYKYLFAGVAGKEDGRKAIEAALIGLLLVQSANYITETLLPSVFAGGSFSTSGINALLLNLKGFLIGLAASIAVLVIIWGGYKYLFAGVGGKEDGRKTILNGVIGLVIIYLAQVISDTIENVVKPAEGTLDFDSSSITSFIVSIVNNLLIPIAAAVTVLFVILAGYKFIFQSGKAEQAKKDLLNALIGFVIILLSVFIVQLIYLYTPFAAAPK
jgi:hypothetical protein